MVKCPDFDRKMLLLATQIANEGDMKTLLLAVLEALLDATQKHLSDTVNEELVLIRCIVRLILNLLKESGSQRSVSHCFSPNGGNKMRHVRHTLVLCLVRHLRTGR